MPRHAIRLGALAWVMLAAAGAAPVTDDTQPQSLVQSLESGIRDAQVKRSQGDYAGAVHMLSQLMLVAPDDPRVVGEYGKVLIQQGRAKSAVDFLTRAVQLQQSDWTLYSALGVAYDQLGDYGNARLAYERALTLKPGEPVVFNNYAMSRMLAGDLPQAKKLIAAAAAASGDQRIAHNVTLIGGIAPPRVANAVAAPAATKPAAPASAATAVPAAAAPSAVKSASPEVAHGAPRPLVTPAQTAAAPPANPSTAAAKPGETTVMRSGPLGVKAGPAKHAKPAVAAAQKAPATKSAAAKPAKPAVARAAATAKPAKPIVAGIPALRLANDKP